MALRNQQTRQQRQATQQTSGQTTEGQYTQQQAGTAFLNPILAQVSGEPVTVIAFGDIPGHSPSYLCVDDVGSSEWISMNDVQILDPRVLPLTQELMGRLQGKRQQQQQN